MVYNINWENSCFSFIFAKLCSVEFHFFENLQKEILSDAFW